MAATTAVPPVPRRRRTVSITFTLASAIASLVFLSVASVLAVSFSVGQSNTVALVEERLELTMQALERRLRNHVEPSIGLVAELTGMISDGSLASRGEIRAAMAGGLAGAPPLMALTYYDGASSIVMARFDDVIASMALPEAAVEILDTVLAETTADEAVQWGAVQYQPTLGDSLINLRSPVVGLDGAVEGVVVALIRTRDLSRMLTSELDVYSRNAFVLYGTQRVLAHRRISEGGVDLASFDPLPRLDEVGDAVLPGIWTGDEVGRGAPPALRRLGTRTVETADESHIVLLRPIAGITDRTVYLGTHVPVEIVGAELLRLFTAGGVGLVLLLIAVVIALLVGKRLARPIRRAAGEAVKISAFDLRSVQPLPPSRITELNQQSDAFNSMIGGLRWLETYVPSRLVRRLMAKAPGDRTVYSVEREVTVLFSDITGFTGMFEDKPAAETATFLNEHFGLAGAAVEAEDGTIDKFIGDCLMAFWNAPDRQPDHAARAARAALAIAHAIEADNARRTARGEAPILVRIGLHTGRVVAGNIGAASRMNYTIVGDAVNTAQRIEALGRTLTPGDGTATILVSAATRAHLGEAFALEDLGLRTVTGRQGALRVHRLLGERAAAAS